MFHPIATVTTVCDVEVSVYQGRYVVEGEEVANLRAAADELKARGCPTPADCAIHAAWKLEEQETRP